MLGDRRARVRLIADGGIRSHTVPLLRRAGADIIVPGSRVFVSQNVKETLSWLRAIQRGVIHDRDHGGTARYG